ncbi:MAG: MFS transporter [Novosphingobium sp.]|nr:MFS transporter [Novosphingobium sp.]
MAAVHPIREHRRVLTAALVGTAVEYYDFFIYGTAAALVLGPLFFPSESNAAQTLLAFMSFGLAFVARPVGAMVFGHFGDRVGRKATLVVSLLMMGLMTMLIGLLPPYAAIGWTATLLLCLLRFGQGLGLGGEWSGAALLAAENAPPGWRARFVSIMQMGSPIGFLLANGVFMVLGLALTDGQFLDWGWRIPFLASAVLVVLGLWVRLNIGETPEFSAAVRKEAPHRVPLVYVLKHHWGAVLAGGAGVMATFATFYLATVYALSYATSEMGYPRDSFLAIQLVATLFYAGAMLVAGYWSDKTSPDRVIAFGAIATGVIGLTLGIGMQHGMAISALMLCALMFALGFANGPLGAWMSHLFPVSVRYSGTSIAFNTGGVIGGAVTPVAAQLMTAAGFASWTGMILAAAGLCTFVGVRFSTRYED